MRVAAALSTWLVVGFLAVFAMGGLANADILEVDPDAHPDLTVLNTVFPGVTLMNQTDRGPGETDVLARDGTLTGGGPRDGENVASTGDLVFGRESAPEHPENLIIWSGVPGAPTDRSAVLRADFYPPAISASIDAIATDDDTFELQAYDAFDTLLDTFNTGMIDKIKVTMSITRTSSDISYILAYGVPPERQTVEVIQRAIFTDLSRRLPTASWGSRRLL